MKSLLNSPASCVEDLVDGLLLSNHELLRVEGFNAIVARKIEQLKESQVTLISGGGSGHEPAHAGFIGDGLLSAAVLGHVFASPSVASILATIRVVAGGKGALLIVKNYTGDRLNFGMALEQARQEGINGKMVIVDDDCALPPGKGITGGRGIAGTILVHKIAGAMAKGGASLDEIYNFLTNNIIPRVRTLGIALSMCHLPTQSSLHASSRLAEPRSIEIGMGIHGEPGREQAFLPEQNAARYAAEVMVDAILARLNIIRATEAKEVVVLINNLGTLPMIELLTVTKEVTQLLHHRYNLIPSRIYVGAYMTSLDMNGVSVSILDPTDDHKETIFAALDLSTTAPAWNSNLTPSTPISVDYSFDLSKRVISSGNNDTKAAGGSITSNLLIDKELTPAITRAICTRIIAIEPRVSEYDVICGDGDCGIVLMKGAQHVLHVFLTTLQGSEDCALFCNGIATAISASMGGTSGALLEICFRAMAASFISVSTSSNIQEPRVATSQEWSQALQNGVDAIRYYGGADVGMRTMLDALVPAIQSLQQQSAKNLLAAVQAAVQAALDGAEATKSMQSLAGRSNYVAAEKMEGIPDPGAFAVAEAMDAARSCFQ